MNKKQQMKKDETKKAPKKDELLRSFSYCTPLGIRTLDPLIKSQLLYQLS